MKSLRIRLTPQDKYFERNVQEFYLRAVGDARYKIKVMHDVAHDCTWARVTGNAPNLALEFDWGLRVRLSEIKYVEYELVLQRQDTNTHD